MLSRYFLPFFVLAMSCSNIGQTEKPVVFVEQLKAVPIWTEKKNFDMDSNVLYKLPVNTNGDIQYYTNIWKFVSSKGPNRAVYMNEEYLSLLGEDGTTLITNGVLTNEFTILIQSNSIILEDSPFSVKELFRSAYEPIDRVFVTNLLSIPMWYPVWSPAQYGADKSVKYSYIRMIVESNGSYYPENFTKDEKSVKDLHWTFVTAKSPTVALYKRTYTDAMPDGKPAPLMEVEVERDQLIWHRNDSGGKYGWPRANERPEDEVIEQDIEE
ncbi:hypothetical protein SAMN02745150_01445 [Brevinema andersonii]|uniref:Lipoprotein n=1 Tax=Brevinema andersonii TaxID=34097 RepID=A0A1I1FAX4_BREAD|nr:hypothetical protein [Brevinema andersonii]SFB96112.1 hypothetical protein SAMN02745150_01445 [Brevinema andersonii]